ncbi:MAG: RagB/SusD family nutrient uptake outer membrane protein [Bacteroidales bacterium]|nr:RagB/SusD family nutrient uptake outer membrane protein [Bacteroidales bacterium]
MKKYLFAAAAVLSAASFTACDDMLDTDPRVTEMTQATFPGKPADVEALNAATYSIMNTMGGGDADNQNIFYWWEVMSDNCYGAGGDQDNKVKSLHYLVEMNVDQYEQAFILLYGGISRANNQIETIDNVVWTGLEKKRNQLLGEAYFMRGLYTLWLTQLYGDVPLITSTTITPEMEQQVSAEEFIYPQILSDFESAKNLMSAEKSSGHANKYVAEAFTARAYMFWAGFYKNVVDLSTGSAPAINLVAQEGCDKASLSQADVVAGLKDIIASGEYTLLKDFRSLWQYSNTKVYDETQANLAAGTGHVYKFIADMDRADCFDMPGNGNGNPEELFQIQFMNSSNWGMGSVEPYSTARMYCNYLSVFWALRVNGHNGELDATYPFTNGWGQGMPSCNIWDDWTVAENAGGDASKMYKDIRKLGSLIDGVSSEKEINFDFVKDGVEMSGYGCKKWNGVTCEESDKNGNPSWWTVCEGWTSSSLGNVMQGDHFEDFYLMRYADVLLMASELTGDASYMNQVQARAGVPQTAFSLKAVQDERRWEFAFEGLRFNDMRRWTGKDRVTDYAPKALQAQAGKQVTNGVSNKITMQHMTCSWTERYNATNGFLSKPQAQITLMNGKLQQNPGWDASDATTQYVKLY